MAPSDAAFLDRFRPLLDRATSLSKRHLLPRWHWALLAALAAFMFWVRMIPYGAMAGGDRIYYVGSDSYYHHRATTGIVEAFPFIPRYDPFTHYPFGTRTGQFSTLFDWVAALAAIVTSGGSPSEEHVARVLVIYPAVLGALIIIPFFFLARRLFGTFGAVVASVVLAVLPGEFLIRSMAGYVDHHVAEALLAVTTILAFVVAVDHAHAVRHNLGSWRHMRRARGVLLRSVLAGLCLFLFYVVWPPSVLFLGILALWLTVTILVEHAQGRATRPYAFVGAIAFATAGLLILPFVESWHLGQYNLYSVLHVVASLALAGWLVALDRACRESRTRALPAWGVPAAAGTAALLIPLLLALMMRRAFSDLAHGLSWVTGVGVVRPLGTIAEARPSRYFCTERTSEYSCLVTSFGITAPVAVVLLLGLIVVVAWRRGRNEMLLFLWSLIIFRATATQIRFSYYLALNIALLVGWAAAFVVHVGREAAQDEAVEPERLTRTERRRARRSRPARRRPSELPSTGRVAIAIALAAIVALPGNVVATDHTAPGWATMQRMGPDAELRLWLDALEWMREATPHPGTDLGLTADPPPRGQPFQYGPNAYGVLTWWDYGHYIQTWSHRIPVANPFQQGAPFASIWFTERDVETAEQRLDDRVRGQGPVRYVMIDEAMATSKYWAITVWANERDASRPLWPGGENQVRQPYEVAGQQEPLRLPTVGPAYTEAMMGRLFDADGDGLSNYRLVWEHPSRSLLASLATSEGQVQCFHAVVPSFQCPLSLNVPTSVVEQYEPGTALGVGTGPGGAPLLVYDMSRQSRLKVFERVPGAALSGTAEPGETVTARVALTVEGPSGPLRSLVHVVTATADDATGAYELRFPYPTTGALGPENGGTRARVVADGPVEILLGPPGSPRATVQVDVPEVAVIDGRAVAVQDADASA